MRGSKVSSPAKLIDGMDDMMKDLPLDKDMIDGSNMWRVIYKGIFNP